MHLPCGQEAEQVGQVRAQDIVAKSAARLAGSEDQVRLGRNVDDEGAREAGPPSLPPVRWVGSLSRAKRRRRSVPPPRSRAEAQDEAEVGGSGAASGHGARRRRSVPVLGGVLLWPVPVGADRPRVVLGFLPTGAGDGDEGGDADVAGTGVAPGVALKPVPVRQGHRRAARARRPARGVKDPVREEPGSRPTASGWPRNSVVERNPSVTPRTTRLGNGG